MLNEFVHGWGHSRITALHRSTFEVTRDKNISEAADCIIVVDADRGAASLGEAFKRAAATDDAFITCVIKSGGFEDTVRGWGSKDMTFTVEDSMVFRMSDYVCGRTVMVHADKPAALLDRNLIKALKAKNKAVIELTVEQKERPKPSFEALFRET